MEFKRTIKGVEFSIEVDEQGKFWTVTEDHFRVEAPSLEELKTKLADTVKRRKVKVAIPFVRWDESARQLEPKLRSGVVTGIHASHGHLLVKYDDGENAQESGSWRKYVKPEAAQELERLARAKIATAQAFHKFQEANEIDMAEEVREALNQVDIEDHKRG